jgi:hypothetical protein
MRLPLEKSIFIDLLGRLATQVFQARGLGGEQHEQLGGNERVIRRPVRAEAVGQPSARLYASTKLPSR